MHRLRYKQMSAFLSHKAMKFLANNFGIAPVISPAGVRMCFSLKYPNTPGGITDPEYSANVGIQNLAASLSQAGVESRIDIERISLGLQGHNCGNAYIRWTVEKRRQLLNAECDRVFRLDGRRPPLGRRWGQTALQKEYPIYCREIYGYAVIM